MSACLFSDPMPLFHCLNVLIDLSNAMQATDLDIISNSFSYTKTIIQELKELLIYILVHLKI